MVSVHALYSMKTHNTIEYDRNVENGLELGSRSGSNGSN